MKKILVMVVIVAAVIASVGIFVGGIIKEETSVPAPTPAITPPIPSPKGGEYLYFRGGEMTEVFLIDSYMRYGTYDRDIIWPPQPEYSAKKGDPCVIVDGMIRNEYDKDYFISLTAEIYNVKGEKVGTVVSLDSTKPVFKTVYVKSKDASSFGIHIKYDKKDIVDYNIFVAFEPTEVPPP